MLLFEYQDLGRQAGWKMRCPHCGNVASPLSFNALGVDPQHATQECIGRYLKADGNPHTQPCNYAAFGLIKVSGLIEVEILDGQTMYAFPFDDGQ